MLPVKKKETFLYYFTYCYIILYDFVNCLTFVNTQQTLDYKVAMK